MFHAGYTASNFRNLKLDEIISKESTAATAVLRIRATVRVTEPVKACEQRRLGILKRCEKELLDTSCLLTGEKYKQ